MHTRREFPSVLHDVGEFAIDPKKSALLVIDMQYYSCSPDYGILKNYLETDPEAASYCADRLKIVIPNCARLINFFRKLKQRIFYAAYGASLLDGSDLHPLRRMTLKEVPAFTTEDFEYQIIDELKPQRGELLIHKSTHIYPDGHFPYPSSTAIFRY